MLLQTVDWGIIVVYFTISLIIGLAVSKRSGKNSTEFFAAGKNMPWWLLGVSMVATTFSTDTPNLVTDIVRKNGVSGNWVWWAFLLTGMLTVFVYAKLWKKSGVLTDIEFYEIRYSGKPAAFLRGFRAIYLGAFFNIVIMASVSLAAIKIGRVLLGLTPIQTLLISATVTTIYCSLGGLRGVLFTDLFQFSFAMVGSIGAAIIVLGLPKVGGISGLLTNENVQGKLSMLPSSSNTDALLAVFIIPLAVQWWSVWYPGSEPGGGGYIAQRMLAAKNEKHAIGASFFFNAAHYALRPWPWIIVALCSLVIFPDIASLKSAFPHAAGIINDDMGYPAMLTFMPPIMLGVIVTSLIAAYMSTISTHLNWGASYIVHDWYKRFVRPECTEKEQVWIGRIATVLLMVISGILALFMENALDNFQIMLQIGAGTGLLFLLRWYWWRINAFSELSAMIVSGILAAFFKLGTRWGYIHMADWLQFVLQVAITTPCWILVTFLTPPANHETLVKFLKLINPGGPGWKAVIKKAQAEGINTEGMTGEGKLPLGIVCMILGCITIYGALFATGNWIYGQYVLASILSVVTVIAIVMMTRLWSKLVT